MYRKRKINMENDEMRKIIKVEFSKEVSIKDILSSLEDMLNVAVVSLVQAQELEDKDKIQFEENLIATLSISQKAIIKCMENDIDIL